MTMHTEFASNAAPFLHPLVIIMAKHDNFNLTALKSKMTLAYPDSALHRPHTTSDTEALIY